MYLRYEKNPFSSIKGPKHRFSNFSNSFSKSPNKAHHQSLRFDSKDSNGKSPVRNKKLSVISKERDIMDELTELQTTNRGQRE